MAESVDTAQARIDAINMIPESVADQYSVVPLSLTGNVLRVGTVNDIQSVAEAEILNDLAFFTNCTIELAQVGTREQVLELIRECYPEEFENFRFGSEYDLEVAEVSAA